MGVELDVAPFGSVSTWSESVCVVCVSIVNAAASQWVWLESVDVVRNCASRA